MSYKLYSIAMLCISIQAHAAIRIVADSPAFDLYYGYDNDQLYANGELSVIKNYIHDGDVVFDIGASERGWANYVFKHHPQAVIHTFEPIPNSYEKLISSPKENLHAYNFTFSNSYGKRNFFYYPSKELCCLSSFYYRPIMRTAFGNPPCTYLNVTTDSLDHFCAINNIARINFIKINGAGDEYNILLGAANLLKNHAIDALQFEYGGTYPDAGVTLKEVYEYLTSMGYKIYRIATSRLIHLTEWRDVFENNRYSNYLAVPA